MFTLDNFDDNINGSILQRGKQYYRNGYVTYIEQTDDCNWTAEVEGTNTYTLEVTLEKNNEIADYNCDCPFGGGTCKHLVAMFFALREEIRKGANSKPDKRSKKDMFEHLLQSINVQEYQDFIRTYSAGNRKFKTEFELFFASKDKRIDVEKKYGELVQKLIKKYSDGGYIDYSSSFAFSREINTLLQKGHEYVDRNNFRDAFLLAKAVLRRLMETMEYADDSDGDIGDSLGNALSLLEAVAMSPAADMDVKEQLCGYIQTELNDKLYFDYGDFGYSLFSIFQCLAVQLKKHELFLDFVNGQINSPTGENTVYWKEYWQKSKISFLEQTGRDAEARDLVKQNMHIVEVRMGEVGKAIKKKDFNTAKKLIASGIKIAESNEHPGTVDQWQKELLRLAVLESDIATIRHYAKHFAFEGWFSSEYYRQWKGTFTAVEWREEIEKLIEETITRVTKDWNRENKFIRTSQPPLLENLASIYVEEKYWDRLLSLVEQENNLNTALEYHSYLVQQYPGELLAIYIPALKKYGIESCSRGEYAQLVDIMTKIIKDIPGAKEKILNVAKELKAQFSSKPRRPAMIEELNKIL